MRSHRALVFTAVGVVAASVWGAGLVARQQILLKRPDLTKVLTLTVDPKSYWIYTNTPIDNARVAETFRQYGFEAGLDRLAASA